MAIIKFTNSKGSIKKIFDYITQSSKTEDRLISGKDCMPETALIEMELTKNIYGKATGRQYIHIVQSFNPNDKLTYEKANQIGVKLAKRFIGFQAVIATHKDRNHIHNHILLNSVNFETGYKFQQSKNQMQEVKDFSDKLCISYGLSIIENPKENTDIKQCEYQVALKGESWKVDLILAIEAVMKISKSKTDFISNMNHLGYGVNWSDNKKYITYTTPNGKKCRDNKLHDKKYLKEEMENVFGKIETNTIGKTEYNPQSIIGDFNSRGEYRKANEQQTKSDRGIKKQSILEQLEIQKANLKIRENEKRKYEPNFSFNHSKHNSYIVDKHDIVI